MIHQNRPGASFYGILWDMEKPSEKKIKHTALLLAAGKGVRFGGELPKQFLPLKGLPIVCHSLRVLEESFMDEIVLVVSPGVEEYCREHILSLFPCPKTRIVPAGGAERRFSVANALEAIAGPGEPDYVYIQDSARPFLSMSLLERLKETVLETGGAVAASPLTDTIKQADGEGFVTGNPQRKQFFAVQTPQVFAFSGILDAYRQLTAMAEPPETTDDVEVYQRFTGRPVKLVVEKAPNLKVTNPADLVTAEALINRGAPSRPESH